MPLPASPWKLHERETVYSECTLERVLAHLTCAAPRIKSMRAPPDTARDAWSTIKLKATSRTEFSCRRCAENRDVLD